MSNFKGDLVSLSKQIEIHPATGVEVDRIKWAYAQNATSATAFVRRLLVAVFPEDVLIMSNLRGGREKAALETPSQRHLWYYFCFAVPSLEFS